MANPRRIGPNRRDTLGGINATQKDMLLEAMRQAPMLALKKDSVIVRREEWQVLAARLNNFGPDKTTKQWETCWTNLMSKARANPESDTYRPIMDVIRQCEASLNNHNAETVRRDSSNSVRAAGITRNGRRRSTAPVNDDSIMQILRQLANSDQRRLNLEQQMIGLHRDVVVVMNQLTQIVSRVDGRRRVSFHEDA